MKEGEEKEEQSAVQSHYNASHARQFVAALVPCPLPYLPARSEGASARSDMAYGDSLGQCVCRLWYGITSWNSSINIQVHTHTVIWA